MANRLKMAKIDAIVQLHEQNWSNRRIATELGIHRDTVARVVRTIERIGQPPAKQATQDGAPLNQNRPPDQGAPLDQNRPPPPGAPPASAATVLSTSLCAPFRDLILAKLDQGLTAQRIFQDLVTGHHFPGKYHSVRRFVRRLGQTGALPFRRMESAPGEEAQVDFGSGAPILLPDGKRRRTHVFRIVLSHSRKGYSEAVYRQTTEEFLRCLENAFWSWGGVPKTLVLDNLKAGVEQPDWYDPELNPKLRSFAAHYNLAALPTKPRMPRHKGKTESGVGYVKGNALQGHVFHALEEQNVHLLTWETTVADVRIHGTTRQQVVKVFAEMERPALQPLPAERFPFFHEGRRSVHRDGHVEVERAYYSVPPEYLTRRVWVRWDSRLVRIFNDRFEQLAVHIKQQPGRFSTQTPHIAAAKISGVERGAAWLLSQVQKLGPHCVRWAEAMMAARGIEGVRVLQGLLSLGRQHPGETLEKACEIAVSYGAFRLRTIRALLKRQPPKQEHFEFIDEHPLIRSLSDYAQLVHAAVQKEIVR
jgi:transposase